MSQEIEIECPVATHFCSEKITIQEDGITEVRNRVVYCSCPEPCEGPNIVRSSEPITNAVRNAEGRWVVKTKVRIEGDR